MLVLSRKQNETVCLPDFDVSFTILESRGSTVKIGIDAPDDIRILRGELDDFGTEPRQESFLPELCISYRQSLDTEKLSNHQVC